MRELNYQNFVIGLERGLGIRRPLSGQIELTYRCNLKCIHCYCKGSEDRDKELSFREWKVILNQIHKEGCLWLTFTGGEPLLREDFLKIYSYAHKKGFLINLFTNGLLLDNGAIDFLKRHRPLLLELTLNAITESIYEEITNTKGTFSKIIKIIHKLTNERLPLVLKCNGLRQNKDEILKLNVFAEALLGKGKFKFDSFIFPRLNGDITPCQYRLLPEEILEIESSDSDMITQMQKELHMPYALMRPQEFLYQCNAWWRDFFINPYGQLQFCQLSSKYSCNITKGSFKKTFYNEFPKLLNEKFTTNSKCSSCNLREICYYCPARAYLETGDEEAPVEYYCQLAKARYKQRGQLAVIG